MKSNKQQKKRLDQTIALIVLVAAMFIVPASAETLEIRGEVVELTTAQSTPITWNAYNFDVFWCDLDDDLMTETLTIAAGTLIGPTTDRTIDKNCLSYQTSPAHQQYELYENEGLTVNGDTGYYLESFMGGRYVAINGRADKLCKHLVEFEDNDKKTLSAGEPWDLGGGFALTTENLSCPCGASELCDSCTLSLSKNGVKIDEQIIHLNTSDKQDRVYTYAPDIGGEERVPVFSCYVDAVFNGTDADIVQLMYVGLIGSDVLEIETGDTFGIMEVMTASSSYILLRNNGDTIDLDEGSTEQIMGDINFKTADDARTIRFYPMVEYSEPGTYEIRGNVVHLDGAQSADLVWDATNFAGFWYGLDDGLKTEQLKLLAGTINNVADDRTIDENTLIYTTSPVYHQYELNENEGLVVDSNNPGGDAGYYLEGFMGAKYVAINNRAEKLCRLLVEFEDYDTKTLATGETWDLGGGFCLIANQINLNGDEAWLSLEKDGRELGNGFVSTNATRQDRVYTYTLNIGGEKWVPVFSCYAAAIFRGTDTNIVQVKYVFLLDNDVMEIETHDLYGMMEVVEANAAHVRLENEDAIHLEEGGKDIIAGDIYFEIADDPHAIRFCPLAERTIDDGETTPPPDTILAIDSDNDGVPDAWDDEPDTAEGYWTESHGLGRRWGDMNGDGKVTSLDALMILQVAARSTTPNENRNAVIETSMGTMTVELYGQRTPNTTANFIELAESGFYDGLIFHRVIDDFVIQGGCPNGDGIGGSGKTIELEIHPDLTHVDGTIAMARSADPNSASSQFYICDGAQHMLDGQYAVFGRVIGGIGVVRAIAEVTTGSGNKPVEDVVITKISIIGRE